MCVHTCMRMYVYVKASESPSLRDSESLSLQVFNHRQYLQSKLLEKSSQQVLHQLSLDQAPRHPF